MNKQKLFSVIIVSFNAESLIYDTVSSVLKQSFEDYEIIIKDAGSTDNTLQNIPISDKITIVSKPDKGIYDGMNAALQYASGRYLFFLNCGDLLFDAMVFEKVATELTNCHYSSIMVYGNYIRNGVNFKQPSKLKDFYLFRTPLCHQSVFFDFQLFKKNGGYNLDYKILADYDLTLAFYKTKLQTSYIDYPVCRYLGGGISESKKGIEQKQKEYTLIRRTYFNRFQIFLYSVICFLSMRHLRERIVSDRSPMFFRKIYRYLVNRINK